LGDPRAPLDRRGARPRAVAVDAVIPPVGTEAGGERERLARLRRTAGLHQRAAEAEERVVVRRRALDDGLELDGRLLEAARAEVGPAERLADGGLLRLVGAGLLGRDGRLLKSPASSSAVPRLKRSYTSDIGISV